MSSITAAAVMPHPPIILPNIGRGEEKKIQDVSDAMAKAAKAVEDSHPETIVVISPHAPAYADYIQLSKGRQGRGNLGMFNDPYDAFVLNYDMDLVNEIERLAKENDVPAGTLGDQRGDLDHGTMVPLYFFQDLDPDTKFVRVSLSGLDSLTHFRLGQLIARAAENLGRKVAIVASGDMSHCQKAGTNYGYKACGPAYDAKVMDLLANKEFKDLVLMPEKEADDAMSCGQKSFAMMAGALDGLDVEADRLAHSAEFGVGYGVLTYTDPKEDPDVQIGVEIEESLEKAQKEREANMDPWARLAKASVESWVKGHDVLHLPEALPEEMLNDKAGAFVTLYKNGQLRGCIGTTEPTRNNVAEEIIYNGISACSRDPRFYPVADYELPEIDYKVDVLMPAEPVNSLDELDPKKYGVIVSKNGRRGLLLPDLEGVDTVEEQLAIAKQKAGLRKDEPGCQIQRFEVLRHQ